MFFDGGFPGFDFNCDGGVDMVEGYLSYRLVMGDDEEDGEEEDEEDDGWSGGGLAGFEFDAERDRLVDEFTGGDEFGGHDETGDW